MVLPGFCLHCLITKEKEEKEKERIRKEEVEIKMEKHRNECSESREEKKEPRLMLI